MFVRANIKECDFSYRTYDEPVEGAHAIARGASGRWCAVMYAGPEWLEENGHAPVNYNAAVALIEHDHPGDSIDF